MKSVIGQER